MYKKLADALGDTDWDRFHSYGKRVRSLKFDERLTYRNDLDTPDLDFTVMGVVCLRHPFGGVLLPNLRKLHWISDAEGSALAILPFLSGELGQLDLQMSTYATSTANDVLKAIAERAPTLVTFSLGTKLPKVFVEKALMGLLQTTGSLEKILLPPDYLTPALIQILGSLPKLKEIDEGPRLPYPRHSPGVLPPLHPGAFPHLTNITFSATLPDARKFLFASQEIASRLQFAKALPKLEALAIFLGEQEAQPLADNFCPQYQFQNLTELHVGLSYVPGGPRPQVGAYIASLCKIRPFIECGATEWHIGEIPRDWANTETAWKEVEEAVGLAMKVKQTGLQNLV
ncbi:hypothetical protein FRC01_007546 [Tulasnella sp. 417]|nr:hypothetical protein FRC01_007546 [Tulasnella sp. 417]